MTPASRIGVLTFHRCINYGSYWQARCLVEGLRGLGYEAELLDHVSPAVDRAEWRCALSPVLPQRTAPADFPLYAEKARKFFDAFAQLPLSPPFPLDDPAQMADYDLVIVGSDEVWNLRHPWYGGKSIFYGDGLRAGRLASYAASFGNHAVSEGLPSDWAQKLQQFDRISIRDENSRQLIETALEREPEMVLDPVMQFPPAASGEPDLDEPYVAIYGHSFPDWFSTGVAQWARENELMLVSIGYRNGWADAHWVEAGPRDFARIMAGAEAVATNFFHGCVFALINGKPFVCAPSDYRFNKVRDLAAGVGASRHLVSAQTPREDYDALLGQPLDPRIERNIATLRQRSAAYLDAVLH